MTAPDISPEAVEPPHEKIITELHQKVQELRSALTASEKRVQGLETGLLSISKRAPVMGSTGDYRQGQLDALSACRDVATGLLAKGDTK